MYVWVNSETAAWIHSSKSCDLRNIKKNPEPAQTAIMLL